MRQPFIVYRDLLNAPSEAFIARMYRAFEVLEPVYLGNRLATAGVDSQRRFHRVADHARLGALEALLFRQLGRIPAGLRDWLRSLEPRLVHAQFGRGGALALPLAEALGLPLVVTFHGGDASKDKHYQSRPLVPTIFQRRRGALAARASLILCVSDHIRTSLIGRGFPANKLLVHHLGIELPDRVGRLPEPGRRRLLFVGRFVEKKGVDLLLRAAARINTAGSPVEVVLVGDGPERSRLETLARELGTPCRFTGWLPPERVFEAMQDAGALVVPSRTAASGDAEGVPTVIYEALARGLPVVASRHAGIPEAVEDEVSGLLAREGDPDDLARALVRLLDDPELWRRLQAAGQEIVRERFDASRQSRRLEALLLEVAREAAARV